VIKLSYSFIVTANAFRHFMQKNRLSEVVERLLAGINVKRIEEIQNPAAQIKEIVHSTPIPKSLYAGIADGYQSLGEGARYVWPTTLPSRIYHCTREYTQSSCLEVVGLEETIEAIKWWWASLFDANLIFHRELNGQKHGDAAITVVANACRPPRLLAPSHVVQVVEG
jgi:phosphoenolpyruvate synthase/pyruvate phosphate dikinase